MNKNVLKEICYTIIAIFLGIMAVKFIIWALPIILVILISHYIYKSIKRHRPNNKKSNVTKNIKIIDMVEDDN